MSDNYMSYAATIFYLCYGSLSPAPRIIVAFIRADWHILGEDVSVLIQM